MKHCWSRPGDARLSGSWSVYAARRNLDSRSQRCRRTVGEGEELVAGGGSVAEEAADELEAGLRHAADEILTLEEAAKASGYSPDDLRHLVAQGELPNAGRTGAPRVHRGDLAAKRSRRAASGYDPAADARTLHNRVARRSRMPHLGIGRARPAWNAPRSR